MLSFDASISIIEWHIGRLFPDIAIVAIVVVTYFLTLAIDTIDSHGGCEPLGYIVRTLILGIKLIGEMIDQSTVIILIVDSQVVGELIAASTK